MTFIAEPPGKAGGFGWDGYVGGGSGWVLLTNILPCEEKFLILWTMRYMNSKNQSLWRRRGLGGRGLLLLAFFSMAAAGKMAAADEWRQKPASYWKLKDSAPTVAYQCEVSIESDYPDNAETVIYNAAADLGVLAGEHAWNQSERSSPGKRRISLYATPEKAEKICDDAKGMGTLRKYSSRRFVSEKKLTDLKRKAELISVELSENEAKFDKLPNAKALLTELLFQYKTHLAACEAVAEKAVVSIEIAATRGE